MQPEDIIQQKQWAELSPGERSAISGLAETEHEFNLLKKIMVVSLEDATDVPEVNPAVKQKVEFHLKKKEKSRWYLYAAAAVLLLFFATLFIKNDETPAPVIVNTDTNKKINDLPSPPFPEPPKQTQLVQQKEPGKADTKIKPRVTEPVYAVNMTVGANPELLDLVTEFN